MSDIVGLAKALQCDCGFADVLTGLLVEFFLNALVSHVAIDSSGADAVGADAVAVRLFGNATHQHLDQRLGAADMMSFVGTRWTALVMTACWRNPEIGAGGADRHRSVPGQWHSLGARPALSVRMNSSPRSA